MDLWIVSACLRPFAKTVSKVGFKGKWVDFRGRLLINYSSRGDTRHLIHCNPASFRIAVQGIFGGHSFDFSRAKCRAS